MNSKHIYISDADIKHKKSFQHYVVNEADPFYRKVLTRLYGQWHTWNKLFFEEKMEQPYITLDIPADARVLGSYYPISEFGGKSQIVIRRSIISGGYKHLVDNPDVRGLMKFTEDILLHYMIHQYHHEVTGELDEGYNGYGPAFRDVCNQIGSVFGLTKVRTRKRQGRDKDLPPCSFFPYVVRPEGYYFNIFPPHNLKEGKIVNIQENLVSDHNQHDKLTEQLTDDISLAHKNNEQSIILEVLKAYFLQKFELHELEEELYALKISNENQIKLTLDYLFNNDH